ncbi:MAG: MBL fold metallo-hydrolase [Caldilineaceae bacterium]|nr:MBL fold metallo-hydrolase [Caldilineaceae bacterium]
MIHVEQHGPVLAIRMARSLFGKPLYWTTAYWVDGLLIDSGPRCTANELVRLLKHLHIDQIAITHAHEDQIGGLAELQRRYPDAPIHASRRAAERIEAPDRIPMQRYRRLIWGVPQPATDIRSYDLNNDRIETPEHCFRVIETPGHTPDHICLFEPERRWLFSGDAYIGGSDITWSSEADLFGVVCSLRGLASLHPERLFPATAISAAPRCPISTKRSGFYSR